MVPDGIYNWRSHWKGRELLAHTQHTSSLANSHSAPQVANERAKRKANADWGAWGAKTLAAVAALVVVVVVWLVAPLWAGPIAPAIALADTTTASPMADHDEGAPSSAPTRRPSSSLSAAPVASHRLPVVVVAEARSAKRNSTPQPLEPPGALVGGGPRHMIARCWRSCYGGGC